MGLLSARRVSSRLIVIAFGLILARIANANDVLPSDLERASRDYDRAQIEGDGKTLNQLLATDYRLVNGAAEVESKTQFIDESTEPGFKLDPDVVERPVSIVWRGAAVLAGEVHLTGISGGKRFAAHIRFSDVWAKRAGQWKVVFTEVTRFAPGHGTTATTEPASASP